VYGKLGITRRDQLADALTAGRDGSREHPGAQVMTIS
jgi:hypothetical protein